MCTPDSCAPYISATEQTHARLVGNDTEATWIIAQLVMHSSTKDAIDMLHVASVVHNMLTLLVG